MEAGVSAQQLHAHVAKAKTSKSKSKKPTSNVSQKTLAITTTTIQLEGSVHVVVSGERMGEHQRNPKNNEGEVSVKHPSHFMPS